MPRCRQLVKQQHQALPDENHERKRGHELNVFKALAHRQTPCLMINDQLIRSSKPVAFIPRWGFNEIALSELDRLQAESLRFGVVLADAGYGSSAAFRHGLDARGLSWAVGIAK